MAKAGCSIQSRVSNPFLQELCAPQDFTEVRQERDNGFDFPRKLMTSFHFRWHENVQQVRFLKTRKQLAQTLVTNVPMFASSVKQLMK